jgi:hypothetical protein
VYPAQAYPVSGVPTAAYPTTEPPAPPRKQRRGLAFVIVVVVLLGLAGGAYAVLNARKSSPSANSSTPDPTGSPSPSPSPSVSPSPPSPTFTGDLRTLLLPAPKGSKPWYQPLSKDGILTIDEMASNYQDPKSVKDDLTNYNFKRGAVRQWVTSSADVEIEIVQFESAVWSESWGRSEVTDIQNGYYDVDVVNKGELKSAPGSNFLLASKADKDGDYYEAAVAAYGDVLMIFEIWTPTKNEASARALTQQQYDKIVSKMG